MAESNRIDAKKKGVKRPSVYPTPSNVNTKINCQMQPAHSSKRVIEEIMQKRTYAGRFQYLVRWKGCSKSDWTWEFPDHFSKEAVKKIEQFDAKFFDNKNNVAIAEVNLSSPSSSSGDDDDADDRRQLQQQHVKGVKDTNGTSSYVSDKSREQGYRQQTTDPIPNNNNKRCRNFNELVAPQRNVSAIRSKPQRRTGSPTKSSHMPLKPSLSSSSSSPSSTSSSASSVSTPTIPSTSKSTSQPIGKWNANLNSERSPNGLELGLELEKIIRSHKMGGETFLVVKWKKTTTLDLVKLKDVTNLYPNIVLAYFTKLPRRR